MGIFVGLKLSDKDGLKIEKLQQDLKLKTVINKEDLHCTLFVSLDDIDYQVEQFNPIRLSNLRLEKMKTQTGVDCCAIFFSSDILSEKYNTIFNTYKATPYYENFKLHITLSYDCGDVDLRDVDINHYFNELHVISEYVKPLDFGAERRELLRP